MFRSSAVVLTGVLAVTGLGLSAVAMSSAPTVAFAESSVDGSVKSVDLTAKSFVIQAGDEEITVRTDGSTKYVLDGKDSTFADVVKRGVRVTVKHEDGLASRVEAKSMTPPPPSF